ncbi:hypothetical protein D3C71_1057810 [compost metagenome]
MNLSVLPLERPTGLVEYVRELLARCEAGEVIAVSVVAEQRGGTYSLEGSAVPSRTQTAGMLLDCAIARLARDD